MFFPLPLAKARPYVEPPAIVTSVFQTAGMSGRPLFKAPPLIVKPPMGEVGRTMIRPRAFLPGNLATT